MKKNNFKRYELKYILNKQQKDNLDKILIDKFTEGVFSNSQIVSIYFDTDNYQVIRDSIEADKFKEKVRLRQYFSENKQSNLFFEIKRKYSSVVYKRRKEIVDYSEYLIPNQKTDQIDKELSYALSLYENIKPKVLITYHRDAFVANDDKTFRLTLGTNIKARFDNILDTTNFNGENILANTNVLMQIKCTNDLPMWFLNYLNENNLYKTSFSKYGTAYKKKET